MVVVEDAPDTADLVQGHGHDHVPGGEEGDQNPEVGPGVDHTVAAEAEVGVGAEVVVQAVVAAGVEVMRSSKDQDLPLLRDPQGRGVQLKKMEQKIEIEA